MRSTEQAIKDYEHLIEVQKAFLGGATIAKRTVENSGSREFVIDRDPEPWYPATYEYKVVTALTAPAFRPWKNVQEVPVGHRINHKHDGSIALVLGAKITRQVGGLNVLTVLIAGEGWLHANEVLKHWVMSATKNPCGVKR